MDNDPFDELFGLEDKYYQEGYEQGLKDGLHQSGLEARIFGIEKGYEKFIEMGKIQARARFWSEDVKRAASLVGNGTDIEPASLSLFQDPTTRSKLQKHIDVLNALVDPATLSTQNSDEAVAEFDDRLKRAQAKCKIIERIIGEQDDGNQKTDKADTAPQKLKASLSDF